MCGVVFAGGVLFARDSLGDGVLGSVLGVSGAFRGSFLTRDDLGDGVLRYGVARTVLDTVGLGVLALRVPAWTARGTA